MAYTENITCDLCGKRRDEDSNNWFCVVMGSVGESLPSPAFARMADVPKPLEPGITHICGQRCAIGILQLWMDTGSIEKKEGTQQ